MRGGVAAEAARAAAESRMSFMAERKKVIWCRKNPYSYE